MIHEYADVKSSRIGEGTRIWQFTVVLEKATIGKNCNINAHCLIENDVIIGNNVTIKSGNYIWDGIHIENNVFIGPNVTMTNDNIPRSGNSDYVLKKALFKEGCSIGGGSILLPGVEVGCFALVGAGSLVTKNVPDFELWHGSPAEHKGFITRTGEVLNMHLICKITNRQYKLGVNNEPELI